MRIGADQRVRVVDAVFRQQARREELEIDLVQDAEARRDQADAVVGLRRPFDEAEALEVALDFELHVLAQRIRGAVVIYGKRVIERHVDRHLGLHQPRRAPGAPHRVAQRREIA